ncbi:MAG: SDR family NAD(P)-dependent oxidoreductase [Oscillospiraceae bacterium]|nr:SDR family NAD(P)-dependent oxidoreductase [Oscillospiraceae bacterium]
MKIAVVTGASSGMGREFVRQLSGYVEVDEVWVIARRENALKELKNECPYPIRPVVLDLCEQESFARFSALLEEIKPDIRLLVNAAGFGKFGKFENVPLEDDLKMIDLNCKALLYMTRLCLPYMSAGSHILQLDSMSAFQPVPYIATYGATKAFVLSYTRAILPELKKKGIRIMAMNPFWVKTEFFDHAFATNGTEVQNYVCFYEAKDVVATGLHDLYRTKKQVSVHGFTAKFQRLLVKLAPHSFVMNVWINQQKKPKNDPRTKKS